MKKFIRYLRLRRQSPPDHDPYVKRRQRYEEDYTLEPFAGLTPEYMEMSECGAGLPSSGGHRARAQEIPTDGALAPAAVSRDRTMPRAGPDSQQGAPGRGREGTRSSHSHLEPPNPTCAFSSPPPTIPTPLASLLLHKHPELMPTTGPLH